MFYGPERGDFVMLKNDLPLGSRMNPTLKKRCFHSGWRALAWAMMKQFHSRASLPIYSVSSPGMSIAHSRANFA